MSRIAWKHKAAFLAFAGLFLVSPLSVADTGLKKIEKQLSQEEKDLKALQEKIRRQDQAISQAGAQEDSVLKKLRKIENQLKLRERELKIYQWNKQINEKKVGLLTKNIQTTENQLDQQKRILARRLRAIYKEGSLFAVKVLFSADNFNDLLQRIKYLEILTDHDTKVFHKFEDRMRQLESEKQAMVEAREKLVMLERSALSKREEVRQQKEEKSRFLKKLNKEKNLNIQVRKELLEASENLNTLIHDLKEKLVKGEGIDIADRKGRLPLPLEGKFLNKFGKKKDKEFDTYVLNNGVNIRAAKGTAVRAVFDGKVLFANELEGYGNLIIVGHGEQYHTLYGHLDNIITEVGKTVRSGQIIARSGDTGSLVGETLYFELRHKGKPIDPMRWFKVAKR